MRTFFSTNVYRRKSAALPEDRYLTMGVDHVRELHAQGHMVLPHTHSHVQLSAITTEAVADSELREPKELLEDLLQVSAEGFAFPIGNERVVNSFTYRRVQKLYSLCFTGLNGLNSVRTDRFFLHRDCVHPHYSVQHVSNIAAGSYDLFYASRMHRLRRRARHDRA
jgi:peptidoglycan/xylan/chitin deacetylase (PgdA/CDA1 family)